MSVTLSSPKMEEKVHKTASFKWTIKDFSKLTEKMTYSEIFYVGGIAWRLLIFPKGNNVDCLSVYLDAADSEMKSQQGWSIDAQFSLILTSQIDDNVKVMRESQHQFNASGNDWGFSSFMPLADLYDPLKGYLVKDTCIIEAIVAVKSVVPPKKTTKTPSDPSKNEGSSAQRLLHIDTTESAEVPSEKSPAKGHVVIQNAQGKPLPSLFDHFGSLKVRNPPYSLPNGYRITEGASLDDGDMASRLIQSSLITSELQPLVEMPVADLANQGYYHLAKFVHYHCASIISAQGLQIKHQEHANALEELHLSLEKSAQEASQLQGDLQKAVEEKAKDAEELAAAKEKIINMEGELKLLFSENVDLQIQLEDARKGKQNAATQTVEDFMASNDPSDELQGDLQKAVEEKAKDSEELAAAKEKIINMEGELKLLFSENVDLQIQLEDARKAKQNAATQIVEDFKASNDHNDELLQGDLQKAVEEKAKYAEELAAAKEKIINLEGELLPLFSENVDLQIQLEDSRKAKQIAATQTVEDFKASNDLNDELRAMAINSLKQATELFCARLKNKLAVLDPSMLDNLAKDAQTSLTYEADGAA